MKIYTKTGDRGETGLFGGVRVPKDQARIEAYGTVDELNTLLGTARAFNEDKEIDDLLDELQNKLFQLGSDLATPADVGKVPVKRIAGEDAAAIERKIDLLEARLEPLKHFILPGGSRTGALLHQARAVCRRAERRTITLRRTEKISEDVVLFLNRLSDYLFVLARYANKVGKVTETIWSGRSTSDPES